MADQSKFKEALEYGKSQLGLDPSLILKEKQVAALQAAFEGHDVIAVLPTGYGKSLIFQLLPWVLQRRWGSPSPVITFVVTPLNSIMQDQVGVNQRKFHLEIPNREGQVTFDPLGALENRRQHTSWMTYWERPCYPQLRCFMLDNSACNNAIPEQKIKMADESKTTIIPPNAPPLPQARSLFVRRIYENRQKMVEATCNMADYATICRQQEMPDLLVGAIEKEDTVQVKSLLKEGVNANAVIPFTRTPLIHAIEDGHEEIAVILTLGGADVNLTERTFPYRTPAHLAAMNGMVKALQELFNKGADIQAQEATAMSPIHFAAWQGHLSTVNWLLQNGAEKDAEDDFQRTPLHRAVEGNHYDVVELLLAAGANINKSDRFNWTPLFHCVICDKPEMVNLLLSHGVDVNTVSNTGNTPLHAACARLRPVITKILLSASPCPVRRGKRIPFPDFEEELARGDFTSQFEIIEALVDCGADVNARNNEAFSPLYLALFFGYNIRVVEFLAHAGAKLTQEAWLNQELYRAVAVQKGFSDILQWMDSYRLQPPSLLWGCCHVIRGSVGRGIRSKIAKLPLPDKIKGYLNLEEFYL